MTLADPISRPQAIRPFDEDRTPQVPPLHNGDHLTREEFHRRYEAMGQGVRAELIEGIVYMENAEMASPVSLDKHATPHSLVDFWASLYVAKTPGLMVGNDSSVFADGSNEPQPDVLLAIPQEAGGQTRLSSRNDRLYVANAPEFAAEVSASTSGIDLNAKMRAYERNGVREYLVALTEQRPPEVRWMASAEGRFVAISPDPMDGLLKSRIFPGLWLEPAALLVDDPRQASRHLVRLIAVIEAGCATDEHAAFVKRLASAETA